MIDWILDRLAEVDELDDVHVVTNARFAARVPSAGPTARERHRPRRRHDARTRTGSARSATSASCSSAAGVDDDLLVVAGDNLFDFALADFVDVLAREGTASAVAVHDVGDRRARDALRRRRARRGRPRRRLRGEAGRAARATLVATATYLYHREHVALVEHVPRRGQPARPARAASSPGCYRREPVYGYRVRGRLVDIGDPAQLLEADNRCARRRVCPSARVRRRARSGTIRHRHVHTCAPYRRLACSTCSARSAASSAARPGAQLCARLPRRAAAASPPPLCERCGAPTAWPVARCARVRRPPARVRLRPRGGRLRRARRGRSSRAWKERGLRGLAALAAERRGRDACRGPTADALTFVPPDGDRSLRRGHHPAERARARARRALGAAGRRRCSRGRGRCARQRGLAARRAAAERRAARSRRAAGAAARSCLVDDVYTTGATVVGGRVGPARGRRARGRGRHVRPRRAAEIRLGRARRPLRRRTRCDFR